MTAANTQLRDTDLLRQYAAENDQEAFARLVRHHIDWVYSAANRLTRDAALADDVTQGVFLALAQRAKRLSNHPNVAGWLFQATQFAAFSAIKRERRLKQREAQAMTQTKITHEPNPYWEEIRDHLDRAVGRLGTKDRDAIVLRFYQQLTHGEVAQTLGIPEDTARRRIARALKRLRKCLGNGNDALLSAALLTHNVASAPTHLTSAVLGGSHTQAPPRPVEESISP